MLARNPLEDLHQGRDDLSDAAPGADHLVLHAQDLGVSYAPSRSSFINPCADALGIAPLRVGTLFSGIGAPETAWRGLGWDFRWCAEIEPFPSAVLRHHFPHVRNLGDVTKVDWDAVEPVDLLCFGSPCQSFSVAGKRLGLDDPRGNLALYALGIARQLRPRWLVFENVPGLLSSDGPRDFGAFLGLLGECGYGFAYRVLDAQHFGVPQRRRRVFVVGHLGDWRRAAAVLFERESLSGHPAPRRQEGARVAGTLETSSHDWSRNEPDGASLIAHSLRAEGFDASEDGTGRGTPIVSVAFAQNQRGEVLPKDIADSLTVGGGKPGQGYPAAMQGATVRRLMPVECERLQGFPDGHTAIVYRGKPAADGPRYKALGNSMAVPVVRWIGQRIALVESVSLVEGRQPLAPASADAVSCGVSLRVDQVQVTSPPDEKNSVGEKPCRGPNGANR